MCVGIRSGSLMLFSETAVKAESSREAENRPFLRGKKREIRGYTMISRWWNTVECLYLLLSITCLPFVHECAHIYIYARSLIPTLSRLAPGELLMIRKCGTVFFNFFLYSSAPPGLVFIFLLCYQSQNIHILIRHHQRRSIFK